MVQWWCNGDIVGYQVICYVITITGGSIQFGAPKYGGNCNMICNGYWWFHTIWCPPVMLCCLPRI